MNRNSLLDRIEAVRQSDFHGCSEAQVQHSIVGPILGTLGWDTYNPQEVVLEYPIVGREAVDYALICNSVPVVLIEAKGPGENLRSHTEQLLKYAWRKAASIAVLTNGSDWWFYLPQEHRDWEKRQFCSMDLRRDDIDIICDTFIQFLSKETVISGNATKTAKEQLRGTDIQEAMVHAWNSLVEEPDSSLFDLVAEVTEKKCGHRPTIEVVRVFIEKNKQRLHLSKESSGQGGGHGGGGSPPGDNKAWSYWQDKNGRQYILAFVNAQGSCSMRRFDAASGVFVDHPPNLRGNYQDNFSEYILSECQLHLDHQPNLARTCKKRLPAWVLSELRPQIQSIRQSDRDR